MFLTTAIPLLLTTSTTYLAFMATCVLSTPFITSVWEYYDIQPK